MEILLKEEAGDLDPDDIEKRIKVEEAVEQLEVFVEKFGSFHKEFKAKTELGCVLYEKVSVGMGELIELYVLDKKAEPKDLFNTFIEFQRQFMESAEKLEK